MFIVEIKVAWKRPEFKVFATPVLLEISARSVTIVLVLEGRRIASVPHCGTEEESPNTKGRDAA